MNLLLNDLIKRSQSPSFTYKQPKRINVVFAGKRSHKIHVATSAEVFEREAIASSRPDYGENDASSYRYDNYQHRN